MRYYVTRRKGRMAYVHRLVAEQMLGRPLRPGEEVHHRNGDKADNRPENLEVYPSHREHCLNHRASHCQRGHEMTEANTIYAKVTGKRSCRECHYARQRRYYHARKAAARYPMPDGHVRAK